MRIRFIPFIISFLLAVACITFWYPSIKSAFREITEKKALPAEFLKIPLLADFRSSGNITVTFLKGTIHFPVENDSDGNFIIGTIENIHKTDESFSRFYFYRLNSQGELLDTFELPQNAYPQYDLIIDPEKGYFSTWLGTGDKHFHPAIPINGIVNREELIKYYNKSENVLFFNSTGFFQMNGAWYFAQMDFFPGIEAHPIENKYHHNTLIRNSFAASTLNQAICFTDCPQSKDHLAFFYFEKIEYISSSWINTGVNISGEHWNGFGYFKLMLGNGEFLFKYPMQGFDNNIFPYTTHLKVYINNNFAVLSDEQSTVLIQAHE